MDLALTCTDARVLDDRQFWAWLDANCTQHQRTGIRLCLALNGRALFETSDKRWWATAPPASDGTRVVARVLHVEPNERTRRPGTLTAHARQGSA